MFSEHQNKKFPAEILSSCINKNLVKNLSWIPVEIFILSPQLTNESQFPFKESQIVCKQASWVQSSQSKWEYKKLESS